MHDLCAIHTPVNAYLCLLRCHKQGYATLDNPSGGSGGNGGMGEMPDMGMPAPEDVEPNALE